MSRLRHGLPPVPEPLVAVASDPRAMTRPHGADSQTDALPQKEACTPSPFTSPRAQLYDGVDRPPRSHCARPDRRGMDFDLTDEQRLIKDTAREFTDKEIVV